MGKSFKYLDSGIQECRPPFLPSLSSSLWKEAEIGEASPDPGDPSMLMPSLGAPPGSWHSSPAAAGMSILPSVLPARRQRRQIPARAWRETRSARAGRLSRDGAAPHPCTPSSVLFPNLVLPALLGCSGVKTVCGAQSCCSITALGALVHFFESC